MDAFYMHTYIKHVCNSMYVCFVQGDHMPQKLVQEQESLFLVHI